MLLEQSPIDLFRVLTHAHIYLDSFDTRQCCHHWYLMIVSGIECLLMRLHGYVQASFPWRKIRLMSLMEVLSANSLDAPE